MVTCPRDVTVRDVIRRSYPEVASQATTSGMSQIERSFMVSDKRTGVTYSNMSIFKCNNFYADYLKKRVKYWGVTFSMKDKMKKPEDAKLVKAIESMGEVDSSFWTIKRAPTLFTPFRYCSFRKKLVCHGPCGMQQPQEFLDYSEILEKCAMVKQSQSNDTLRSVESFTFKGELFYGLSSNKLSNYSCKTHLYSLNLNPINPEKTRQPFDILFQKSDDGVFEIKKSPQLLMNGGWETKVCKSAMCDEKKCDARLSCVEKTNEIKQNYHIEYLNNIQTNNCELLKCVVFVSLLPSLILKTTL